MSNYHSTKRICPECSAQMHDADVLTAPNPFDPQDTVTGCPKCRAVTNVLVVCDEPGCWREASGGAPTLAGYRHTCSEHIPPRWS